MANLPVFCEYCGAVSSVGSVIGFSEGASGTFDMVGNKVTCPNCGKFASIVDGTYEFAGDTIKRIRASKATVSQLKRLVSILERAKDNDVSPFELSETIRKEVPELYSFSDALPETRNELYGFITTLVAVVVAYIGWLTYQETIKQNAKPQAATQGHVITNNTTNYYYLNKEGQTYIRPKKFRKKQSSKTLKKKVVNK